MNLKIWLLFLLMLGSIGVYSEELGVEEDTPPPTPSDLPIDGGISLLVGAGIAYGSASLYKAKGRSSKRNQHPGI